MRRIFRALAATGAVLGLGSVGAVTAAVVPAAVTTEAAAPAEAANVRTLACPPGWRNVHFRNHWDACVAPTFNTRNTRILVKWEWGSYQNIHRIWYCGGAVAGDRSGAYSHSVWYC